MSARRRVLIESPYAGDIEKHLRYARAAVKDCLDRGEAPFASHLLYTQEGLLDDNDPVQRQMGIDCGFIWGEQADASVIYIDLGMSEGMLAGVNEARETGRPIEYRSLPGWGLRKPVIEGEPQ